MLGSCQGNGALPHFDGEGEKVMSMRSKGKTSLLIAVCALGVMVFPAAARADTVTLSQDEGGFGINFNSMSPSNTAGDVYPSTINGPEGTVNDVNVSVVEQHTNLDDLDVALVSPNGTAVHIFSDACGDDDDFQTLRFDDSAFPFLPDPNPCNQSLTYKVSNYGEIPDPYPAPGPTGGTMNQLSFLNGGPSGGAWRLFATDDTTGNGGQIGGWTMTLDYTPPSSGTAGSTPGSTPTKKCKKRKKKTQSAAVAKKKKCKKKKKR
jgi:subtilisin-like proprotein convertase family protein